MVSAFITFLLVYAIYAFIAWLRNKKNPDPNIASHKRIARTIWPFCLFLIGVAIFMVNLPQMDRKFYRPLYGQYEGFYFPNGRYSNLKIGNIRENSQLRGGNYQNHIEYSVFLLGHKWEELEAPDEPYPYQRVAGSFGTYDSNEASETFGHGIILHVFDLDEDVIEANGNETAAYEKLINAQVSDSSLMQRTNSFSPFRAIETHTMGKLFIEDETLACVKHITLFANNRAYAFVFYVDKGFESLKDIEFNKYDEEFSNIAKQLDLKSFQQWQQAEKEYERNLLIQSWIYTLIYILCIAGAIAYPIRYIRSRGTISMRANKWCKVLGIVDIATFAILGISFIVAFCTIHSEHIREMYQYRFDSYINEEYAATSVLCYGIWFLLLIVPLNRLYIKSFMTEARKYVSNKPKRTLLYWFVKPFVVISNLFSKLGISIRDEYQRQKSEK